MNMFHNFFRQNLFAKILVILAFLSFPVTVFAATTTATQVINAGALTISAPASETFSSVNVSLSAQVQTLTFSSAVSVSDLRGSSNTFTAQVTSTDFVSGGNSIAYTSLEYKSTAATSSTGDTTSSITVTSSFTAFSGSGGTSDPTTVMAKNNADQVGSWQVTPDLRLTIDAQKPAGTYGATLTFSVS